MIALGTGLWSLPGGSGEADFEVALQVVDSEAALVAADSEVGMAAWVRICAALWGLSRGVGVVRLMWCVRCPGVLL